MDERRNPLELIRLLYGDQAEEAIGERLMAWAEAFEAWLTERQTRFSRSAGEDSLRAWAEFLAFTQKAPWEAQVEDVEAYVETLKDRGLRAGTILGRLAALGKFYEHCQAQGIDPECGANCGEHFAAGFNPVAKARRPSVRRYEKANALSPEEERALLKAMRRDPSPTGVRDHALFLTLLRTGRRAGEIRRLKWGALSFEEGQAWIKLGRSRVPGRRGAKEPGEDDEDRSCSVAKIDRM